MLYGYTLILLAGTFWGSSAVWAKHLIQTGVANPVIISQTRVSFAWLAMAVFVLTTRKQSFIIPLKDIWRYALLGAIGMAGANYGLYYAVEKMDTAVADLIQFTAPVLVAIWMWARGHEGLDRSKVIALVLSLLGCGFALGAFQGETNINLPGATSAIISAVCYAFLLIFGKHLSSRYLMTVYLHYAFLAATLIWIVISPPSVLATVLSHPQRAATLVLFSFTSVLLPYVCFFAGLKRVPASRAGIVSTWEPVVVTLAAWIFLGENLGLIQIAGIVMVCIAIVLVEIAGPGSPRTKE